MTPKFAERRRHLQRNEKFLLLVVFVAFISLWGAALIRNRMPREDMATPEDSCKSLVKALLQSNEKSIKNLTTPHGYVALQQIKNGNLESYPKVGDRILTEWGRSILWEDFIIPRTQTGFGLTVNVRPGENQPAISFQRTSEGWKLDNYVPQPDRIALKPKHTGHMWKIHD